MGKKLITTNKAETQSLARELAREIIRKKQKQALVIGLKGDLGGGKTTFVQGFAKGLGIKQKILSPTFVILKRFNIKRRTFYHIDCYRIKSFKELISLGFREIVSDPKNIIIIEWAEKIKNILPKNTQWIEFSFIDENARAIDFL